MSFPAYPEYKDSGVEWLGSVPAHWTVDRIKWSIVSCKNGLWGNEPQGDANDFPCVRVADFDRRQMRVVLNDPTIRNVGYWERADRVLKRGDLILEKSGGGEKQPVGFVVLYDDDRRAICSNFTARVALDPGMATSFWRYVHGAAYVHRLNVPSIKQTSGIQNLDQQNYLDERAAFPPLDEQRSIARFLEHETARIDALIEEQQRLIELLKEKRQAVISHAVTKGLDPDVPIKDSGVEWLGKVPNHWKVIQLKFAVRFQRGHDLPEDSRVPGDVPIVSSGGISGHHSEAIRNGPAIVTGRYGSIGEFYLIEEPFWPLNTTLYSIDLHENSPEFLWLLLIHLSRLFISESNKAAVSGIDRNDIHPLAIALPPYDEQIVIANEVEKERNEIEELVQESEQSIELLRERRSALISAAVTGKIDVRDWQPPEGRDELRTTAHEDAEA